VFEAKLVFSDRKTDDGRRGTEVNNFCFWFFASRLPVIFGSEMDISDVDSERWRRAQALWSLFTGYCSLTPFSDSEHNQVPKGYPADALALRGDEGRGTLR
jgi:hypothetical protein